MNGTLLSAENSHVNAIAETLMVQGNPHGMELPCTRGTPMHDNPLSAGNPLVNAVNDDPMHGTLLSS